MESMGVISQSAPGRVNLIGEHTDYNGGYVLPTAIPQTTNVELRLRQDQDVHVSSIQFGGAAGAVSYRLGEEKPRSGWHSYVMGVTYILRKYFDWRRGFDLSISSQVPVGSGLSSSAALEVSLLKALRKTGEVTFDDLELARLAQKVENEFVGARVGIMDPMACNLCELGVALFLDTRTMKYEQIRLPEDIELIVINSGVSHSNEAGDYNQRRSECESACKELGIKELRDLTVRDLARLDQLSDLLRRRARHVITENDRVLQAVQAIKAQDSVRLGQLFNDSHLSMRDDYQVSVPAVDTLVELCQADANILGARLTGGGFGGSIVALARRGYAHDIAAGVARAYERTTKNTPTILVPDPR